LAGDSDGQMLRIPATQDDVEAALLERDRELRRSHRIVGALSLPLSMFTRLRSNPFFVHIANRVDEMLDADFRR
jgi:hypothetical protein